MVSLAEWNISLKRPTNGATFRFIWKDSCFRTFECFFAISPFITIQGNAKMAKVLIQCDTSQVMIDQWTHKQWSRQVKPPSRVWTRCSFRLRSHVVAGFCVISQWKVSCSATSRPFKSLSGASMDGMPMYRWNCTVAFWFNFKTSQKKSEMRRH